MQITVKLYASFRIGRFSEQLREYPDDATTATIAKDLDIPPEYLIMLRNGRHALPDDTVHDGDTVSLLPMLEGG